jgi:hypothetical protein
MSKQARKIVIYIMIVFIVVNVFSYINLSGQRVDTPPPVGETTLWNQYNPVFGIGQIVNLSTDVKSIKIKNINSTLFQLTGVEISIFPDSAFVYELEQNKGRGLNDINIAEQVASKFGFSRDEFVNKETTTTRACPTDVCLWEKKDKTRRLEFNIPERKWTLSVDYNSDIVFRTNSDFATGSTSPESVYQSGINIISDLGFPTNLYTKNWRENLIDLVYGNINFAGIPTFDRSLSNVIIAKIYKSLTLATPNENTTRELNVRLSPINGVVYFSNFQKSGFLFTSGENPSLIGQNIYSFEFYDRKLTNRIGSYKIISANEAWTKITLGDGFLVDLKGDDPFEKIPTEVEIREFRADRSKIEIAYLEPERITGQNKGLIVPIYVFRGVAFLKDGGQKNFVFIVSGLR